MKRKLSALSVGKLPAPATGQIEYSDADLPGFALRVSARGVRSYVLHYRPRDGAHKGKLTRWTIGRMATDAAAANGRSLLTLGQAREIARHARIAVRDGGADPARNGKPAMGEAGPETYGQAVEQFIALHQIAKRRNRSAGEVRRMLLKEGAAWHDRPLAEIARRDVHSLLDRLMAEGTPYRANRTHAALRGFFRWCVSRDKVALSPCEGVLRPFDGEKARDRHLGDDEIRRLWGAADRLGGHRAVFLKLMLLSGKRRGELAGLTWGELDLDKGIWTLPADRAKNARAHAMPLPALAVRILRSLPRISGNPLVFPGRRDAKPMSGWTMFQRAVQAEAEIPDFSFHCLRHTLKTRLGTLGIPPHIKDKVLNHSPPRSAGEGYDHYDYATEQRSALDQWAGRVGEIVWGAGIEALHG